MAPASSSEAGGKPSASSKPSSPVAAPGIDESRGGIKNPFYDHRPNAVPITDTGEQIAYYAITYPIAVARAAVTFGTIFIYLLYVLSVMPLLLWMRKRAPRPDGPDGQPPSALIYNLEEAFGDVPPGDELESMADGFYFIVVTFCDANS